MFKQRFDRTTCKATGISVGFRKERVQTESLTGSGVSRFLNNVEGIIGDGVKVVATLIVPKEMRTFTFDCKFHLREP